MFRHVLVYVECASAERNIIGIKIARKACSACFSFHLGRMVHVMCIASKSTGLLNMVATYKGALMIAQPCVLQECTSWESLSAFTHTMIYFLVEFFSPIGVR